MIRRAPRSNRKAALPHGFLAVVLISVAAPGIGALIARPVWAASLLNEAAERVHFPAKLKVLRASVRNGRLEALLSITGRATGAITIDYQAAGQFQRTFSAVGPPQEGEKLVRVSEPLPARQRAVQTGIINAAFAGDATTQSDSARLRAANSRSGLTLGLLTFADGRLSVSGSIDSRLSGIVRLRVSYLDSDGSAGVWTGRAAVTRGAWGLDEKLPVAASADANAYLSMQFTGKKTAPGGPYRGEQLGKSLGNFVPARSTPPGPDDQARPDVQDSCGADEDVCVFGDE